MKMRKPQFPMIWALGVVLIVLGMVGVVATSCQG